MSRYDWPQAPGADREGDGGDDSGGRARFNRRLRGGLGRRAEAALHASRTPQTGPAPAATRAPASGPQYLWQPLGPLALIHGQASGNPRVSGRVNAICAHTDGQRVYAASANGGVWYSKDGGANWVSVAGLAATNTAGINRPAQRNACGALYVEFGSNEGEDTVFLGTGEVTHPMSGSPGASEGGIGILVADWPTKSTSADPWVREAPNLVNNGVYRIVCKPGGATFIAATRTGLYQRPSAPDEDEDWVRPTSSPFDSLDDPCTDALWTDANGGRPARLWVWVQSGNHAGLWVRDEGADDFAQVAVDAASAYGYTPGRAVLAAPVAATQVWLLNNRGAGTMPALFRVTNPTSASATAPKALGVNNVPDVLRDAGSYAIAIAAHPTLPDRVVLAGNYFGDSNNAADLLLVTSPDGVTRGYDASIVVADVAADPAHAGQLTFGLGAAPYTMIGIGVHPDMHALDFSNAGATLWACCDGGIFRSDDPTRSAGFYPRNQGMSISESNYLACHPRCEGHVIAGLQDNGVVTRLSSGVWDVTYKGDGGGVLIDATRPERWAAQYIRGTWYFVGGGGKGPIERGKLITDENGFSSFYSAPASIAHVRSNPPAADVPISQTLIGTHRLWYSDDFGVSWVTLKTGTDPLPATVVPVAPATADLVHDIAQDSLGEGIIACRWQDPDTAWALVPSAVHRFSRAPGSHNGGGPGTWTRQEVLKKNVKNKDDFSGAEGPVRKADHWTDIQPNLLPPPAAGQPAVGAIYLGTVGQTEDADVDTLWWFDGTSTWYPTGLRGIVPAPVLAIAVDPALPLEVWVGTTVGVWVGTRTPAGTVPPTWTWAQRVNGLPEAAVEDLAIFRDGTLRLLRAAIAARGVWELRLDTPAVPALTYLRAHDHDLRHRATAAMLALDGTTLRSWHGSPDVRPRPTPALAAPPADLPWTSGRSGEVLRRFQTALHASTGDPRVASNGLWDAYFSEVLRDHAAPTLLVAAAPPLPAYNRVQIDAAFWNLHMTGSNATAEPWGIEPPTEADLRDYTFVAPEGSRASTSCHLAAVAHRVDVVVHHRGEEPRPGAEVRVTLLKWIDTAAPLQPFTDSTTWAPAAVPWSAAVSTTLNSADGASPGALGGGWDFVGSTDATRRLTLAGQTLDALNAGIATFDLDLGGIAAGTVVLLVAVIRAGDDDAANDVALPTDTLEQLVLTCPNVAVRSIDVT